MLDGQRIRVLPFWSILATNFEQVCQKICLNSFSRKQVWVPGIVLIDPSSPRTICWVGRNGVSISKHDHVVLSVPRGFSEPHVFHQDRAVIQKMSRLVTYETAISCCPWARMIHPLGNRKTGRLVCKALGSRPRV